MRNLGGGGPARPADGPSGGAPTRRSPLLGRGRPNQGFVTRTPTPHAPPSLRSPQPPKPAPTGGVRRIADIPQHLMQKGGPITVKDVMDAHKAPPGGATVAPPDAEEEGGDEKGKGKGGPRPGGVAGRDVRRAGRDLRAKERKSVGVQVQGGRVIVEDDRE